VANSGSPLGVVQEPGVGTPPAAPAPEDAAANDAAPGHEARLVTPTSYEEAVEPHVGLLTPPFDEAGGDLVTAPFAEPVPDDRAGLEPVDYQHMTIQELRELARRRNVRGRSAMNRDELIEVLRSQ
jgi:Rho termination factor, N-terminal domain